jgi:hypothetical protein
VVTLQTSMEFIATLSCALFAGAAVYINVVEHPARVSCGTEVAAVEWAPSYKRATWMQAPLAVVGFRQTSVFCLPIWTSDPRKRATCWISGTHCTVYALHLVFWRSSCSWQTAEPMRVAMGDNDG